MKKKSNIAYLLIAPTYILFFLFFMLPLVFSFGLTFFEWNGFSWNGSIPDMEFVGFANYMTLFQSKEFFNALKNTLIFAVGTAALSITVSTALSYFMTEKLKGFQSLKAIYFLPHIVSLVAVGVVWNWVFLPSSSGLLNSIIGFFGISPKAWLADPVLAMPSLMIIGVWKSVGYNMVILVAGLLSIPTSLYEASEIDGATPFQQFRKITLPLLRPTLFFIMVSSTIFALFQVFDIIQVTTGGGPVGKTDMLVTYLYRVGFKNYEIGYASAIAFVLFILTAVITIVQKVFIEEK